jgi:hypothetical protein
MFSVLWIELMEFLTSDKVIVEVNLTKSLFRYP